MPKQVEHRLDPGTRVHDVVTGLYGKVQNIEIRQNSAHEDEAYVTTMLDTGEIVKGWQYRFHEIREGLIRISEVDPIPATTPYAVDVHLKFLESNLEQIGGRKGLNLDPDFQRGHVWNDEQRERFVEYRLRGGRYGRDIWFNSIDWGSSKEQEVQIVDGLQRLTAMRMFLRGEVKAFGQTYQQFHEEDQREMNFNINTGLRFHVNNLATRVQVLKWYLDLNAGGTPHTATEIMRVRGLLEKEIT